MRFIVDCCISLIRVYIANAARLCKSVSLFLPLIHSIALYTFWCFLVYAMVNCVLSISLRSCKIWIFRPLCGFDCSSKCFICFISVSRSTKLPATGKPMRWNCIRKSSCFIAECLSDLNHHWSDIVYQRKWFTYLSHYLFWSRPLISWGDFFTIFSIISQIVWKSFSSDFPNLFMLKWFREKEYFFVDSLWSRHLEFSSTTNFFVLYQLCTGYDFLSHTCIRLPRRMAPTLFDFWSRGPTSALFRKPS